MRVLLTVHRRPRRSGVVSTRRSGEYDSGGAKRAPKIDVRERELSLVGASGGDGEMNATHAGANLSAELEELEANGRDRCVGEVGMTQADTTQSVDLST